MGFWESVLRPRWFSPRVEYLPVNPTWNDYASVAGFDYTSASPVSLWRSQPHLRTVVSFVARNIAQLGVHVFERVGETDRRRDRDSVAARALGGVDGVMTTYELIYALVGDLLLYDRAYWWVAESLETKSGWMIRRLPPAWVDPVLDNPFAPSKFRVALNGKEQTLGTDKVLAFTGYSPSAAYAGSPTIEALRQTLQEQVEAAKYRGQVWKRGGRVSAVLERPAGAPTWSDAARERFRDDWYAKYTGNGKGAGGTPILEDGMKLSRIDFNAQEQQYVEAAKLSLTTVAAAFHVNPTMVGLLDNANYSNVREFRKMLYGDTLGPTITQIEQRINGFLLPMLGDRESRYVELNIAEKLQGNFEEQAEAMQTATGGPWMTRNEARARVNLPAIDGGDDLIVPLNVITGGQASPTDSGSQNRNSGQALVKAAPSKDHVTEHREKLAAFFARQEAAVRSRMGAKSPDWWDADRWNTELAVELYSLALKVSREIGRETVEQIGFAPDAYNIEQTKAFLAEASRLSAESINEQTLAALEAAESGEIDAAFEKNAARADQLALGLASFAAGFASVEAGRQSSPDATKTWVTGQRPRPEHAALNGQTVGIDDTFSNGLKWPGAAGPADEVAGCNCTVSISI